MIDVINAVVTAIAMVFILCLIIDLAYGKTDGFPGSRRGAGSRVHNESAPGNGCASGVGDEVWQYHYISRLNCGYQRYSQQ